MSKIKSGRVSRFLKIGTTVVKATGAFALEKASEVIADKKKEIEDHAAKIKAAKEIITSMGELKGGLMKVGQMISITEDLVLPKEITQLFKTLQKNSPAMPQDELIKIFIEDFGKSPLDLYMDFELEPIASASIGQVHLATTKDGKKVAVKVQYPKIVNAIKSDLKNIDQIDKLFGLILPKKIDITPMLEEMRDSLIDECDYKKEAANAKEFREILKDEFPNIIVPEIMEDLSSERILTMNFLEGEEFDHSLTYSKEVKDSLGQLHYDSFLYCFFQKGILHTDPQDGNYLFTKDKIILLDFGSVRRFSQDFIDYYALMCRAIEIDDFDLYRLSAEFLGVVQENDEHEKAYATYELAASIYKPFLTEGAYKVEAVNPFQLIKDFVKGIDNLSDRKVPKREFLLLDRANVGLFTKLKKWESDVNWLKGKRKYQDNIEIEMIRKLVSEGIIDKKYEELCK